MCFPLNGGEQKLVKNWRQLWLRENGGVVVGFALSEKLGARDYLLGYVVLIKIGRTARVI